MHKKKKRTDAEKDMREMLDQAAEDLESIGDEIRLKMHLANMDAKALWSEKLEPRWFDARNHAREAKTASLAAVRETIKALEEFSASL